MEDKRQIHIVWNNKFHKVVGAYLKLQNAEKRLKKCQDDLKEQLFNRWKNLAQAEFDAGIAFSLRTVTIEDG